MLQAGSGNLVSGSSRAKRGSPVWKKCICFYEIVSLCSRDIFYCVIANTAWQSQFHVIASAAWQSHKKKDYQ